MMERARALGGWLDISGRADGGTTLMVSVPRRHAGLARSLAAVRDGRRAAADPGEATASGIQT